MDEVIKSFLVGLGFGVDDASLSKFNKAIASATLKVTALYGSIQATTAGIAFGISKISQGFEDMAYEYRLIAPAINKALILRQELFKAYNAAGINILKTVQSSIKLNLSLTKTKFALEAIYKSVGAKFFDLFTKQSDIFRDRLYKNMPKIQAVLERFIFFVFKAFDATVILGERVWSILTRIYDFFVMLHKATDGWSTVIIAAIAAWKLLNLSFLATPLGALLALGLAIVALYDDFKTFVEGGQSFINWGSETTKIVIGMVAAITAVGAVWVAWQGILVAWTLVASAVEVVMGVLSGELSVMAIALAVIEAPVWLIVGAITALVAALVAVDAKWKLFGGTLSGFFSGVGGKVLDFFAGSHVQNGIQNAAGFFTQPNASANIGTGGPGNAPVTNPVSSNTVNTKNQNAQHINQTTNVNVTSSADAQSVGRAVGSEQGRVNSDMARNFRNPTAP